MNLSIVFVPLMLLASNCAKPAPVECPAPSVVAPAAIGRAAYVEGLGSRLGHGDEQNVIAEAVAEIHRMEPTMDTDAITNVLIAADCPIAVAGPDHDETADRRRIANFRAQVDQVLAE